MKGHKMLCWLQNAHMDTKSSHKPISVSMHKENYCCKSNVIAEKEISEFPFPPNQALVKKKHRVQ